MIKRTMTQRVFQTNFVDSKESNHRMVDTVSTTGGKLAAG